MKKEAKKLGMKLRATSLRWNVPNSPTTSIMLANLSSWASMALNRCNSISREQERGLSAPSCWWRFLGWGWDLNSILRLFSFAISAKKGCSSVFTDTTFQNIRGQCGSHWPESGLWLENSLDPNLDGLCSSLLCFGNFLICPPLSHPLVTCRTLKIF